MCADEPRLAVQACLSFATYDPADERRRESLFSMGNGLLTVRGCSALADPADASHYPGTYRAGCYDRRSVRQDGESAEGHDSLVNLPNWLPLTFRVAGDTDWFALDRCDFLDYRHSLHAQGAITQRWALVQDAQGRRTLLCERLLVSMARQHIAALQLEITPQNWHGPIELRSAIDADVSNANTDRSLQAYRHLIATAAWHIAPDTLVLTANLSHAAGTVAIATRTYLGGATPHAVAFDQDAAALRLSSTVAEGQTLAVGKVAAVTTSRDAAATDPAVTAQAELAAAGEFPALEAEHRQAWNRLWRRATIRATDRALEHASSFHILHLLQTASPHSAQADNGLPSRGWQEAYHGHVFWDEIFAFPFLHHRFPEIARGLLLYRYRRLDAARHAAHAAGYRGAMFPWRSATTGTEETPRLQINPLTGRRLPDHTRLQHHIGAAIAHNIWQYYRATGDVAFLADHGAEMMIEIARFWASIAQRNPADGRYDICGVIGPDEYHTAYAGAAQAGLDNSAYTNVMAALALQRAGAALDRLPPGRRDALTRALRIDASERCGWHHIARRLRLCFHSDGVLSQFDGFDRLKPLDRAQITALQETGRIDWVLDARGDTANARQITKQADVLMLLYLFPPEELIGLIRGMGYAFDRDDLRRTADYYLARITHESSLSRPVCAGALCRIDPAASWQFFQNSLCIDLDPGKSASAEEGLHLGAISASMDVLQRHYLGIAAQDDRLCIAPAPPRQLGPVCMRLCYRDGHVLAEWNGAQLHLIADAANPRPLPVRCQGRDLSLPPGGTVTWQQNEVRQHARPSARH